MSDERTSDQPSATMSAALVAEANPFELHIPFGTRRMPATPRASCLKGSTSARSSPSRVPSTSSASSSTSSSSASSTGTSSSTPRVLSPGSYSFSAPRCFSAALPARSVHFDASPPQSFDTFSAEDYDRSQIECTRGGSDLDMSMSSRCRRYTGDGEEDCDTEDDFNAIGSPPLGAKGSTGWVCLKNGALIGSINSASNQLKSQKPPVMDSEAVSLPSHGIRFFGGLARKHPAERKTDMRDAVQEEEETSTKYSSEGDLDLEEADEAAKSEAAALAALPTKSPNATPKGSPSIKLRWAQCTGYFESPPEAGQELGAAPEDCSDAAAPSASTLAIDRADSAQTTPRGSDGAFPSPSESVTVSAGEELELSSTCSSASSAQHTPRIEVAPTSASMESELASMTVEAAFPNAGSARMQRSASDSSTSSNESAGSLRPSFNRSARYGPVCASESSVHPGHSPSTGSESSTWSSSVADSVAATPLTSSISSLHAVDASDKPHNAFLGLVQGSASSPISSRCSSIDPWSSLSSGDEGTSSPYGEWSNCASPEMGPYGYAHHAPHDGLFQVRTPDTGAETTVDGASPQQHHLATADPHKTVLSNALTALQAAQQAAGPCSSGDEESLGLKPPRRKPSGSRSPLGGRRKSSRDGKDLRDKSGGATPTEAEEDCGGGSGTVSPGTEDLSRRSSRSSSRRASNQVGWRRRPAEEIEDEGALGGF